VLVVLRERREEDDRDRARALALLDHLRDLEPVHLRHLDVQQDHREVLAVEQDAQGLCSRFSRDEVMSERLEDRAKRDQVVRPVVDEQKRRHQVATVVLSPTGMATAASA
jgi:hypothetical protein